MDSPEVRLALDLIRTAASVAIPFVLVWAAHMLQRRQKFFESVMSEKAKHYAAISPLINKVFAYRMELGDYLLWAPEEVLAAKRKADEERRARLSEEERKREQEEAGGGNPPPPGGG